MSRVCKVLHDLSIRANIVSLDASRVQCLASRANVKISILTTHYALLRYLNLLLLLFLDWHHHFLSRCFV
jgi:hypothetical protein